MSPTAVQLDDRVSRVLRHLRRRAAVAATAWIVAGLAWCSALAWILVDAGGWRPGSNVPFFVDALMVALIAAGVLVARAGARRWFAEARLARSMEHAAGLRPGAVRGSLELARALPHGVSDTLAARAVAHTVADLGHRTESDLAGDLGRSVARWTRRGLVAAGVSLAGLVALGLASPERAARAWAGVSAPFSTMANPVLPALVVAPGSVEVLRGADVQLRVTAEGRQEVELSWQSSGDVARSRVLEVRDGRAAMVLEAVSARTEYGVRSPDGAETERFEIVPIDPLFVNNLVIGVSYPPHTGLPPEEFRGDAPPLTLPSGTGLSFEGAASRPLDGVALVDSTGAEALTLEVNGSAFSGDWSPGSGGVYEWAFADSSGGAAEIQPSPLEIEIVPDAPPSVAIVDPGRDTILPLNLQQPLVIDARDDWGLRRVELVAYRVTAFGEAEEPVVQGLALEGTRGAVARPVLDVSRWGLVPGDEVRYYARVVDNNPVAQSAVSPEYALRMRVAREFGREAEETLEEMAAELEALREAAARRAEENRDQALEDAADRADRPTSDTRSDFERREELQRVLDEQADMLGQVDSLLAELGALEEALEEAGQSDPELAADLEQLQQLMQELGSDQMRQRMEEMADALQQDQEARADQSLEQLAAEQERFGERLQDALEQFERAALEQDFRATTEELESLARQQDALADAMREADDPGFRADQQADLAERTASAEANMQELTERLAESGQAAQSEQVRQAQDAAADARANMEEAAEEARSGDSSSAADRAEQAARDMEAAASQLRQSQSEMAQQGAEQAETALNQGADEALQLARRQAELREQMRNASSQQLADMRSDEASLMQGLENLAQNLQAGTQQSGGDRELSAQVGEAMQAIQETLDELSSARRSSEQAGAQAEQATSALNELAMMAMQAAAEAGVPSGEGRSGQDMARQMGALAQRQGDLLAQTGQMMPMRLSEQALAQQLSRMAEQQQSVASDLNSMAGEPGSGDALGDLEEYARQAEELAAQLGLGRLTPEVAREQERLFHRLLDAGRTLEQEELSEERESAQASAFDRAEIGALTDLQLGAMSYELPDGEQLRRLSPAVRQLVLEYFERLNRGAASGGGP